ncbi:hypothetical protein Patl1_00404 [Pistacia atlantica]|uniref:Uncharacterized protein n=1 Tax=Pistacia atlantica TaxID=434234 RepID=A0ACC1C4P8_9ROSI|nr:hypothetical protein Patl1_00404 [Pistacia atlantica]
MVELQGTLSYKPTTQMAIVDSFTETRVCNPALRITIRSAVAHFYSDENSGSSGINFATMYSELLIGGFERSVYMTGEMAGVIETPRSPPQSLPREKVLAL